MNIYQMNDCDWYAAANSDQAIDAMAENMGHSRERLFADGLVEPRCPRRLTGEELDGLSFHDEDDAGYGKPDYEPRTFRQQLARMMADGEKFPCFFASTEY